MPNNPTTPVSAEQWCNLFTSYEFYANTIIDYARRNLISSTVAEKDIPVDVRRALEQKCEFSSCLNDDKNDFNE